VPDLFFLLEQHVTVHHGNETAGVSKYRARFTVLVSCLPGLQIDIITVVRKPLLKYFTKLGKISKILNSDHIQNIYSWYLKDAEWGRWNG